MASFIQNPVIAVIGLGYVGLPLAVEFGKKYKTLGFDINRTRLNDLIKGHDSTLEVEKNELLESKDLTYIDNLNDLRCADIYIITVPTPIDEHKQPDLSPLISASEMIGKVLSVGNIVIYESTVYPGATEEKCVPVLEKNSSLVFNNDFFVGYSPERINPGDKKQRLVNIKKITSGSTPEVANYIDNIYSSIIHAGTYKAESIKVAEAAKVIENTQRDINIAVINEFAQIFNTLGIDTQQVLNAAGTKWNFMKFQPGLVGGHCIGVDPYYLCHKAQTEGYIPDILMAGRRINNGMGAYISKQFIDLCIKKNININGSRILILGFAFKENCPDYRNTRVIDIVNHLDKYGFEIDIHDPWVNKEDVEKEYKVKLRMNIENGVYDGVICAVPHKEFIELGVSKIQKFCKENFVIYDVKSIFDKNKVDGRL